MRTLIPSAVPEEELEFIAEVRASRPLRLPYQEESLLPKTVLGWLPFLWQRVLFPGRAKTEAGPKWAWWVFLVLPGLLLYPCMTFPLFEPDEGRYAQIPREMLTANEWIVPTLQGEPYLDKPPLVYWLVMGSFSLFGFQAWAARLVPALAVHGTILLTYLFGRQLLGAKSAFWGALLLTLAPAFTGMGRLLILDGVLTLWMTLALFAAYRALAGPTLAWGWWLTAALACGLAILTKGPVTLILLVPPVLAHRWLTRGTAGIGKRGWAALVLAAVGTALPWYLAVCLSRPEFIHHFLWEHNVLRFFEPFDHIRPIWFYVPILLGGLLPGMMWLPSLIRLLLGGDQALGQRRCPALGFFLLAGTWCVLFFSLSGSKLPTYIMPAFPLLALALGHALVERGWAGRWWTVAVMVVFGAALAVGHYVAIPWYAEVKAPLGNAATIEAWCTPETPVYCFPRNVDSVAFHLGRSDFETFRSKHAHLLGAELKRHPRAVVLFGHRNSPETLTLHLPPELRIVELAPLGLCQMAVVEKKHRVAATR